MEDISLVRLTYLLSTINRIDKNLLKKIHISNTCNAAGKVYSNIELRLEYGDYFNFVKHYYMNRFNSLFSDKINNDIKIPTKEELKEHEYLLRYDRLKIECSNELEAVFIIREVFNAVEFVIDSNVKITINVFGCNDIHSLNLNSIERKYYRNLREKEEEKANIKHKELIGEFYSKNDVWSKKLLLKNKIESIENKINSSKNSYLIGKIRSKGMSSEDIKNKYPELLKTLDTLEELKILVS